MIGAVLFFAYVAVLLAAIVRLDGELDAAAARRRRPRGGLTDPATVRWHLRRR